MKTLIAIIVVIIVIAGGALLWTRRSSNKTETTTPATTTQSTTENITADTDTEPAAEAKTVSITDMAYAPAALAVKEGDKVTWTNNDDDAHTVTIDSGTGPNSGTMQPGESYSYTFTKAGTYAYHCTFHPSMMANVTVE
jgi:plastocyanin